MTIPPLLDVRPTVRDAMASGAPVVALESTLIAHGLPWPTNLETALAAEEAVRGQGAVPATIAVWHGIPTIGLNRAELEELARAPAVLKASRRDLGAAIARKAHAATTVSGTMTLAHHAGIRVFATGGIGGAHRPEPGFPLDLSADLFELSRTPVAVVCAGAKSILDLPATLEWLESLGVPVLGLGIDEFPAFYVATSGLPVSARVESVGEAAAILGTHWSLGGAGAIVAQPVPAASALEPAEFELFLEQALAAARQAGVRGPAVTPFLLRQLAEASQGRTLQANVALIVANARTAARLAVVLAAPLRPLVE